MTDSTFVSNVLTQNFLTSISYVLTISNLALVVAFWERGVDFVFRPRDDSTKGTVKNELDHTV